MDVVPTNTASNAFYTVLKSIAHFETATHILCKHHGNCIATKYLHLCIAIYWTSMQRSLITTFFLSIHFFFFQIGQSLFLKLFFLFRKIFRSLFYLRKAIKNLLFQRKFSFLVLIRTIMKLI